MDRRNSNSDLQTNNPRRRFSVYRDVLWSWDKQSHDYPENDRGYKRNRHYKYIPAIIALFFVSFLCLKPLVVFLLSARTCGSNSSGSVTNQVIQVLQGPYITNTYGGGIQCQSSLNITPFVTGSASGQKPFEDYYDTPVYDMRDLDEDGAPDNPGSILWMQPTRTGSKR